MSAPEHAPRGWISDLPPLDRDLPFEPDPVIEAYKRDVDRSLLRENLRRTLEERFRNLQAWQRFAAEWRQAGRPDRRVLTCGDIDLLGEIVGGGRYGDLLPHTLELEVFGAPCRCLDLETLIAVKRAAGRPKDLEALAELEAIWEERRKLGL